VIYVWYDALANYVSALGYGGPDACGYRDWWVGADRRVHVIGKGVLRFHAVFWPAILLSAGVPLPTDILVHDYLTANGAKIGKSRGNAVDPIAIVDRFGADALRWWFLREVPRTGDVDFSIERVVDRADTELANGVGNLASRVATLVHRYRDGAPPVNAPAESETAILLHSCSTLAGRVDAAVEDFDLRRATGAIVQTVTDANRYIEATAPWTLAREGATEALDTVLGVLVETCRVVAAELAPFVPGLAGRLRHQFEPAPDGRLPPPEPVFPRLGAQSRARKTSPVRGLGQK
jgi:methionyl-tRNA synthetase